MAGGRRAARTDLCIGQFVVFLPLHATVLEPNFNLSLVQAEVIGNLDSPATCEVSVEMELFLQLQSLVAGVTGS